MSSMEETIRKIVEGMKTREEIIAEIERDPARWGITMQEAAQNLISAFASVPDPHYDDRPTASYPEQ